MSNECNILIYYNELLPSEILRFLLDLLLCILLMKCLEKMTMVIRIMIPLDTGHYIKTYDFIHHCSYYC